MSGRVNHFASIRLLEPHSDTPFHAWFSAKAAAFTGYGIWLHADGREVAVTLAHHDRVEAELLYGWDDRVYVGLVVKRLRDEMKEIY